MRNIFIAILLFCSIALNSQAEYLDDDALMSRAAAQMDSARNLVEQKQSTQAIEILNGLRGELNGRLTGVDGASIRYNLACNYSLAGAVAQALDCLEESIELGYANENQIVNDTDLESLRGEPRYQALMSGLARSKTFWENPVFASPFSPNLSEDEKIAGLSRLWMEAKYNFANFALVPDLNWDSLYVAYLPRVRTSKNTHDYYLLLQEFTAQLKDGHTDVSMPRELSDSTSAYVALATRLIEDRVIVVRVLDDELTKMGIVPGVEITALDGEPVKQYVERTILPYQCSSTEQDLLLRSYGYSFLSGYDGQRVKLDLLDQRDQNFARTITLGHPSIPPRPLIIYKVLDKNIAYLELTTFNNQDATAVFDSLYPQIAKADAIIFDVRRNGGGNSSVGWHMLSYLTEQSFKCTQWKTRDYKASFRAWGYGTAWYDGSAWDYPAHGDDPFTGPVVVLTSAQTFSAAEDFTAVFDQMQRGTIIGEATGGSTGQPLMFSLPGGGNARVCTKHDSYVDGTEFIGIGILPDIEVHPTVKDIRAGRDTVLDAALAHLKKTKTKR